MYEIYSNFFFSVKLYAYILVYWLKCALLIFHKFASTNCINTVTHDSKGIRVVHLAEMIKFVVLCNVQALFIVSLNKCVFIVIFENVAH